PRFRIELPNIVSRSQQSCVVMLFRQAGFSGLEVRVLLGSRLLSCLPLYRVSLLLVVHVLGQKKIHFLPSRPGAEEALTEEHSSLSRPCTRCVPTTKYAPLLAVLPKRIINNLRAVTEGGRYEPPAF